MSLRHSRWIVPTALALAVTTAWAGEIRLYERPDFRGPSLVTSSPLDTVARQGLGDSASSVVVADVIVKAPPPDCANVIGALAPIVARLLAVVAPLFVFAMLIAAAPAPLVAALRLVVCVIN